MEITFLREIIIILALSTLVILVCHQVKIPSLIGFLLTGTLAGPHGLGFVHGVHEVEIMAEIGIIFLLFTIGMEFSFKHLLQIRKPVLIGGPLQVIFSIALTVAVLMIFAISLPQAIFIGFLLSLSSTAIVLKILQERLEIDSPHGKTILGILLFQDLVIVPMMLLTPLLTGKAGAVGPAMLALGVKALVIIALVYFSSTWLVPQLLYQVTKTKNKELFLLSIVAIGLLVAWLTASVGLSLALGAFLAGLIIAESEYSHQALGNILPFRDIFVSFFFVSVGMLLDIHFFGQHVGLILVLTMGVLVLKTFTGALAAASQGYPLRTMVLSGLALSQVGEFAFVLSKTGTQYGLLQPDGYQLFLAVSIMTMALTPLIIKLSPHTTALVMKLPVSQRMTAPLSLPKHEGTQTLTQHIVIIGFGLNGQNVAWAARTSGIPYAIIETNAKTVRSAKERGEPIVYGDATQEHILEHVHITRAQVVVIAISDPVATQRVTAAVRRLNPIVYIIVRTRFVSEMGPLHQLGADAVIPEEFETSIEIFTLVMQKYLVPQPEIERFIAQVRADGYDMFRSLSLRSPTLSDLQLHSSSVEMASVRVEAGCSLIGYSLVESNLRSEYGVSVLAIRREHELMANPDVQIRFDEGDLLVLMGEPQYIKEAVKLFAQKTASQEESTMVNKEPI